METRKLYYEDAYLTAFSAVVTDCRPEKKGWCVTLDATAFYPEGGGQAADTGTLGGVNVLDVQERDGEICHFCDGPLEMGARVTGKVDFEPRFYRMQQHTGEHILCGLVHKRFGWHNVGFHMGEHTVTVDFDGPIPADALSELEQEVNRAIWQNLPVESITPSIEELPQVVYRTKRELPWPVRIIRVPGYDSCACCGLHVQQTGEIGVMKIVSSVKFHEGVRLEIVCGRQATELLTAIFDQNRQVSQAFSAQMLETGDAARKANSLLSENKYTIAALQSRIRGMIAETYQGAQRAICFEPDLSASEVRELADAMANYCSDFAAAFSGGDDTGYSFCVISRSRDLRQLGKALVQSCNGKGGGRPDCQQGSLKTTRQVIEELFSNYVE